MMVKDWSSTKVKMKQLSLVQGFTISHDMTV